MNAQRNIENRVQLTRNPPRDRASGLAWATLLLGIISWLAMPVVGAIGAVVCGFAERRKIADGTSSEKGHRLVQGGLILAAIQLVIAALTFMAGVLFAVLAMVGAIAA